MPAGVCTSTGLMSSSPQPSGVARQPLPVALSVRSAPAGIVGALMGMRLAVSERAAGHILGHFEAERYRAVLRSWGLCPCEFP
jgi:hypothetical protein